MYNFEVGDIVICKAGLRNFHLGPDDFGSGGSGYEANKVFTIRRIDKGSTGPGTAGRDILWAEEFSLGVYADVCEPVSDIKKIIQRLREEINV